MSTCERVSLLDAARELGMNPQGLREYMKRGLIDIGLVLPNSKGTAATGSCTVSIPNLRTRARTPSRSTARIPPPIIRNSSSARPDTPRLKRRSRILPTNCLRKRKKRAKNVWKVTKNWQAGNKISRAFESKAPRRCRGAFYGVFVDFFGKSCKNLSNDIDFSAKMEYSI